MSLYPIRLSDSVKTLQDEELRPVLWKNVREGNIVYLYAQHEGKKYGCGPFQVVEADKRILKRIDSCRPFIHYPEELYRLKI